MKKIDRLTEKELSEWEFDTQMAIFELLEKENAWDDPKKLEEKFDELNHTRHNIIGAEILLWDLEKGMKIGELKSEPKTKK